MPTPDKPDLPAPVKTPAKPRAKRPRPGRPSKFTPEVVGRLLNAISLGATYNHACMAAGISFDTFNNWRQGRGFDKTVTADQKTEFLEALQKAEGVMVTNKLKLIDDAAKDGTWQAAAWLLERRHPRDYGRNIHEHTGPEGSPLTVVVRARTASDDLVNDGAGDDED